VSIARIVEANLAKAAVALGHEHNALDSIEQSRVLS
jgi:hypothetical protein